MRAKLFAIALGRPITLRPFRLQYLGGPLRVNLMLALGVLMVSSTPTTVRLKIIDLKMVLWPVEGSGSKCSDLNQTITPVHPVLQFDHTVPQVDRIVGLAPQSVYT